MQEQNKALSAKLDEQSELIKSLTPQAKEEEDVSVSVDGEEVSKSTETEIVEEETAEVPEDKSVDYISKSADGVPEVDADASTEDVEEEFNPAEHVNLVTDYYLSKGSTFDPGTKQMYRAAVQRVKRGQGTEVDIDLFKHVVEISKNSEN